MTAMPITSADIASHHNRSMRYTGLYSATLFLIVIAMIFGGGGKNYPLPEMLINLCALPVLFFALRDTPSDASRATFRIPLLLLVACIALVIVQLIPLPPYIWQSLPGRSNMADVANIAGMNGLWQTLSIEPSVTFRSGLSLIVPGAMLLAARHFDEAQLRSIFWLFIGLALLNLIVGLLQISLGSALYPYKTSHMGLPLGFFANRNHVAVFWLIAIVLSAGLLFNNNVNSSSNNRSSKFSALALPIALSLGLLFTFGILATSSRTVMALLLPAILVISITSIAPQLRKKWGWLVALCGTGIAGSIALLAKYGNSEIINKLIARFGQSDDHRFEFWPDSISALWGYFPFGSGIGTFKNAFRPYESIDIVGSHFVNSAHNEVLEIGIEAGAFGLLLLVSLFIWIAAQCWRIWRQSALVQSDSDQSSRLALYAGFSLALIMLASLIDYPSRRHAISILCALLISAVARGAITATQSNQSKAN
jgi:O-antigen ligase